MDGRVQLPVLSWIRENYSVDFVDVITAAGMDGLLVSKKNIDHIVSSINTSISVNGSTRIFVVGHHDCRGNPVDEKAHHEHIMLSVKRLKGHWPKMEIIGLWVNSRWLVELI
jgi:hypothetical protein